MDTGLITMKESECLDTEHKYCRVECFQKFCWICNFDHKYMMYHASYLKSFTEGNVIHVLDLKHMLPWVVHLQDIEFFVFVKLRVQVRIPTRRRFCFAIIWTWLPWGASVLNKHIWLQIGNNMKKTRHTCMFVKHGCQWQQQSQNMAKISMSYILTPPTPRGMWGQWSARKP